MADRQHGRAGHPAARYRSTRAEIKPLVAVLVGLAALGALLYRHGTNARVRIQVGGEA